MKIRIHFSSYSCHLLKTINKRQTWERLINNKIYLNKKMKHLITSLVCLSVVQFKKRHKISAIFNPLICTLFWRKVWPYAIWQNRKHYLYDGKEKPYHWTKLARSPSQIGPTFLFLFLQDRSYSFISYAKDIWTEYHSSPKR